MSKQVTHINCPAIFEAIDDYLSHLPLVWLILEGDKEKHPFAEFGSGNSTNIFKKYCGYTNRKFESYENDKEWVNYTGSTYIDDYKNLNLLTGYVLFIDGKPGEERKSLIEINKDKHILFAHDTEPGANYVYGMAEVLSTFKYRVDYCPEGKPWTTVVSNFVNIEEWI